MGASVGAAVGVAVVGFVVGWGVGANVGDIVVTGLHAQRRRWDPSTGRWLHAPVVIQFFGLSSLSTISGGLVKVSGLVCEGLVARPRAGIRPLVAV